MASPAKPTLQLPHLKTRDKLIKAAPQLARYLAGESDGGGGILPARVSPLKGAGGAAAAGGRPRSPGAKLGGGRAAYAFDEITEEERLNQDLQRVKAERASLLSSLSKLRNDAGKSGGELQADDIRLLRREIEAKKEKLNELRRATKAGIETLEALETTSRDCEALMPQGLESLQARNEALTQELAGLEQEIVEEEAKSELYRLLEARTRREHQAAEQAMREARAAKEDAADDCSTLTRALHEMRAAKEEAETALGATVRGDWQAKLRDQRKVVRDLERRRQGEARAAEAAAAAAAERAQAEAERSTRTEREREAHEARLSAVVPQLEALEATWARLHALTASSSAEGVIAFWQELKAKEANMRELVRLAEERETRAKEELAALLGLRAGVFDSAGNSARSVVAGGAEDPGKGEGKGESSASMAEGTSEAAAAAATGNPDASAATGPADADNGALEALAARTAEARRRKAAAEKKFSRLSQVCVAAEQGLQLLSERLRAAMSRGAEVAAEAAAGEGSGAASERRRTSLINGMRRITSVRRSSLGGIRRLSAVGFIEGRRQSQAHTVLLDAGAAADIATHVPAGSGIKDKDFFPALPGLVASVSEQLGRLLALEAEMEAAEAMARDAGRGSLAPSEASEAAAGSPPGSAGGRVRWADRQVTPRVGEQAERGAADAAAAATDAGREARSPEAAAADGEKQLRKGFRRRTWAGPAWLEGAPPTTLLAKKAAAAAAASSQAQMRRLVGYVEPEFESESDDGSAGQAAAFGFDSDEGSDGEAVVDRLYLKHRAHKLTAARAKAAAATEGAAGGGSPSAIGL